jgi:hypothetical protein
VAGLDPAAARQEIRQAVQTVCQAADRQSAFHGAYTVQNCLSDAEDRAMAQYRAYQQQAAQGASTLASNDASSADRGR